MVFRSRFHPRNFNTNVYYVESFIASQCKYRIDRHLFQTKSNDEVEVLNMDNNQKIKILAGSPLSLAAVRSGMRLSFQCKQGTCSSCETMLDGKRVRTCITKVPSKKNITIKKAKPL